MESIVYAHQICQLYNAYEPANDAQEWNYCLYLFSMGYLEGSI